jgi:hypothetical protein
MPLQNPSDPEPLSFDEAINSFNSYSGIAKIPRILFLRIKEVMESEMKLMNQEERPKYLNGACEAIAQRLKVTRDEVKARLTACQPRTPLEDRPSRPRQEAWPSVRSIYHIKER